MTESNGSFLPPEMPPENSKPTSGVGGKFNFWILLPLFLLVVVIVEVVIYYRKTLEIKQESSLPKSSLVSPALVEEEFSNLEIAKKVLNWLDKQRDERGVYYASRICDGVGGNCDQIVPSGTSAHYIPSVIWGRFKYYQITKDSKELEIIKRDLDIYSDEEKAETIQNDFWNCGLMFELWESNLFFQEEKEKIESICLRGMFFPSQGLRKILENEKSGNLLPGGMQDEVANLDLENVLNKKYVFKDFLLEEDKNNCGKFAAYPFDFASLYLWRKDEKDLVKAEYFFSKTAQLYIEEEGLFKQDDFCSWGVSSLALAQATGNKDYLDFAKSLFEEKIATGLNENRFKTPVCVIFTQKLFETTQEEKYHTAARSVINYLIDNAFDFQGKKGFLAGDGGFFKLGEQGGRDLTKDIRFNGLVVGYLSK